MDGSELVGRLSKLSRLHSRGALTDEEFAAAKASLLGGLAEAEPRPQPAAPTSSTSPMRASIPASRATQFGSPGTSHESSEHSALSAADGLTTAAPAPTPASAPSTSE